MKRRILSLFLAFMMVISMIPMNVSASETASFETMTVNEGTTTETTEEAGTEATEKLTEAETSPLDNEIEIVASGECGATTNEDGTTNLQWTLDSDGVITISGKGEMANNYVTMAIFGPVAPWIDYKTQITSVVIESDVTSIGKLTFNNCTNLKTVSFGEGLQTIGISAFLNSGVTEITFPSGLQSIGQNAFSGCSKLEEVTIAEGVTELPASVFKGCSSLTSITIPESVESIGESAFQSSGLTSLSIPETVKEIGDSAFTECNGLVELDIPATVTVGVSAFSDCTELTTVKTAVLSDSMFARCTKLENVTFNLTEGITTLPSAIFQRCTSLKSIIIPEGITTIKQNAFNGCSELESITLPSTLTTIDAYVFAGCTKLKEIKITGEGSETEGYIVENNNLYYVSGEEKSLALCLPAYEGTFEVPNGVTVIADNAFSGCKLITEIKLPESLKTIGSNAFYECTALEKINIPDTLTSIGESAFRYCSALETITLPDSLKELSSYLFANCSGLKTVQMPSNLEVIGNGLFMGCSSLNEIKIPDTVTTIGNEVFSNCSEITTMEIPNSVTSIGSNAFMYCTNLSNLALSENLTSIGNQAFAGCTNLKKVNLPDTLATTGTYLFNNCTALEAVVIPDGFTSIPVGMFQNCESLIDIEIPASVQTVENNATNNCTNLQFVYYKGSSAQWETVTINNNNTALTNAVIIYNFAGFDEENIPEITVQPQNVIFSQNEEVSEESALLIKAKELTDGGKYYFNWYQNTENSTEGGTKIDGQEGEDGISSKCIPDTSYMGTTYYYCKVIKVTDNGVSIAISDVAAVGIKYDGLEGTGSATDPYKLEDEDDLETLYSIVASGANTKDMYFEMTGDITLPDDWKPIGSLKENTSSSEKGKNVNPFSGTFDGNGHTVTVPYGGQPLFGYVREATVENLNIYGEYIAADGLVANYEVDYGEDGDSHTSIPDTIDITNVTIKSGTIIKGNGFISGEASGTNTVNIKGCVVENGVKIGWDAENKAVAENGAVGSFAGYMSGTITNCKSSADVYGENAVGGIVGAKSQTMGEFDVKNSSFHGTVNATGEYVGGIVGRGYISITAPNTPAVSIQNCYVTGTVEGAEYVGGIFGGEGGLEQAWDNGIGYIRNNYFSGSISADGEYVGGIIGFMRSLNRYNVIENNYYLDSCGATKGIGGVEHIDTSAKTFGTDENGVFYYNTSKDSLDDIKNVVDAEDIGTEDWKYTSVCNTNHNRSDDPLGADADKLAKAMTASEFADGTVLDALNNSDSSLKNWVVGEDGYPELSDKAVALDLSISGEYKTKYYVGEDLDLSGMVLTVTWSDGTTTNPSLDEIKVTGYDNSKRAVLKLTLEYGAVKNQIEVTVLEKPNTNITVKFTLLGDEIHDSDSDGKVHTLSSNNLITWIEETEFEVDYNATVKDVLETALAANGMSCSNPNGYYVESITKDGVTLAEFDNGIKSGWMYTLNVTHPLLAVNEQFLEDGDSIVFHYTDDYTVEEGSEGYLDPDDFHTHTLVKTEAKEATATTAGNIEFYTCESCGKVFKDAEGKVEITVEDTKIPAGSTSGNNNQSEQIAAPAKVKLVKTKLIYTGKARKPAVTVINKNGTVIDSAYYTVSYKNNKKVGTATVKVTFKDKYESFEPMTATFKIVPKNTKIKNLIKGSKQIKVTWKAQKKQTTGYQIQYSTSKKFTAKTTKSVKVKVGKTSRTLKNLKAKKTYYVRIRTYKKVSGKTYYSAWSKAKSVKAK